MPSVSGLARIFSHLTRRKSSGVLKENGGLQITT
jgi:hypothetical protein